MEDVMEEDGLLLRIVVIRRKMSVSMISFTPSKCT